MAKLIFDMEEVRALIEHALSCKEHTPGAHILDPGILRDGATLSPDQHGFPKTEQIDFAKVPAHLQLVKDSGVYLMSSGRPHLPGKDTHNHVVYAKGYGPDADYETVSRVSGDDFVESIDLAFAHKALLSGATSLVVDLSATRLAISSIAAPAKAPAVSDVPKRARKPAGGPER